MICSRLKWVQGRGAREVSRSLLWQRIYAVAISPSDYCPEAAPHVGQPPAKLGGQSALHVPSLSEQQGNDTEATLAFSKSNPRFHCKNEKGSATECSDRNETCSGSGYVKERSSGSQNTHLLAHEELMCPQCARSRCPWSGYTATCGMEGYDWEGRRVASWMRRSRRRDGRARRRASARA
ncbi:hypothetical protein DENSPDRAFT_623454 [Dentipellis sp. KUC8613]|nr:hypothetical protein DENSPDRAFT_623454 [Dentipellis sp. KUC8613]